MFTNPEHCPFTNGEMEVWNNKIYSPLPASSVFFVLAQFASMILYWVLSNYSVILFILLT